MLLFIFASHIKDQVYFSHMHCSCCVNVEVPWLLGRDLSEPGSWPYGYLDSNGSESHSVQL